MKRVVIQVVLMVLCTFFVQAQTIDEWFSQNKTQIKYLISQIAAYEIFKSDLTHGYDIAKAGLTFIGDTTGGEFDLHRNYFNSLEAVSPAVAGYSRINDIMTYESAIISSFKKVLQTTYMTKGEMAYLTSVYNNLSKECGKSLDELTDIVTSDTYTMTDDQRLRRIDVIYEDMKDKYAFSQSFTSEALLLAAQRQSATSDISESLINNGLQ
jgi:hypothetical protein